MRSLAVLAAAGLACGHAPPTGAPPRAQPLVAAYPALRWVPADASIVITAPKVERAAAVLRNLAAIYGILNDFDLSDADQGLERWFGVDPMSADSLHDAGIDPDGGVAIWAVGGSPTIAIALSDPQRTAAFIDQRRGDKVVEVSREQGADVYTYRLGRENRVHWVIADGWLFVHEEADEEHEPELAWYRAARAAAGAYAGGPDVEAAQAAAARLPGADKPGAAPVLAAIDLATWIARMKPYTDKPMACFDLVSSVRRVGIAASIDGAEESGSITVELAGADPSSAALAPPPGWAAAREGAALQAEWTLDVDRLAAWIAPCFKGEAQVLARSGVRGGAAFIDALDVDAMTGRGALWFVARDTHLFDDVLDHIPGLSLVSHTRTVAGVGVTDVSAPMLPAFSFARTPTSVTLAVGDRLIDAIVTGTAAPAAHLAHLAHLEIHPYALPDAAWQRIFAAVPMLVPPDDAFRAKTLRRLRRWDVARVDLDAAPGVLVLSAHGHVHT